jgi:DNA-binding transcriptional regulator YdaS (Cro superfamily)
MLGISGPSVAQWRRRGVVPAERAIQVEAVTGLSRRILRPDLYPPEAA